MVPQIEGMSGLDYLERLQALHLYTQEQRRERYQIIFLWKVAQGLVHGYHATFVQSDATGPLLQSNTIISKEGKGVLLPGEGGQTLQLHPQGPEGHFYWDP